MLFEIKMTEYLFIDIRKSDEVYYNRLDKSSNYDVYYIPMYMIRFNVEMINQLKSSYKEIYIICHSGKRSKFIKDKYFLNDTQIITKDSFQFQNLSYGMNKVTLNNKTFDLNIVGSNSFNVYSIMRITQIILGTLILVMGLLTLFINGLIGYKMIPLIILLIFGLNALINGLTSTCTISEIFVDNLN